MIIIILYLAIMLPIFMSLCFVYHEKKLCQKIVENHKEGYHEMDSLMIKMIWN